MPVATIVTGTERHELKTLPEGYVVIRRMNYGESLKRQAMSTRFLVAGSNQKDFQGELDMQTEAVALWDFGNCIIEHNLTDENDKPLNFKNPVDVKRLAKPVGDEIAKFIDDLNNFEDSDEAKN